MKLTQQLALSAWVLMVITVLTLYFTNKEFFEGENLATFLQDFTSYLLLAYIALGILRAFTLIPSVVHILLGMALFPNQYVLVFCAALGCVMFSSVMVYYFSDALGLDGHFRKKYPRYIQWLDTKLKKYSLAIIIGWAAFPLVPTDVISYVAGVFRINLGKFMLGIFLGEVPFILSYLLLGTVVL